MTTTGTPAPPPAASAVGGSAAAIQAVLAPLDPQQRAVAEALHGPVCVLAGAGTGKTRAITHRIAHAVLAGVVEPSQVLAVTFTTRAAGEMRSRLHLLGAAGVQARTFHSAALRQARYFWPQVTGAALPPVTERTLPLVARASRRVRTAALDRDLHAEIGWAKVSNVLPEEYAIRAERAGRVVAGADLDAVGAVYEAYETVKRESGVIDLTDVLLAAVGVLDAEPTVARQVRAQYRWFVVDEYQDVSPVQQRLLQLWLGDRNDVCVVGDPAQTIYTFAGATAQYLLGFRQRYPDATTVRLVRNYRSTPQVLDVANAILRQSTGPERAGASLQAHRPDGEPVVVRAEADEPAESVGVAALVGSWLREGTRPQDVAVLVRTNAQIARLEEAFADARVPVAIRGAQRFFDRPEVKRGTVALRAAALAADATAPAQSAGADPDGAAGTPLGDAVRAALGAVGWSLTPPVGGGAARDAWESLTALVLLADDTAAADPRITLRGFVDLLAERAQAQHAPDAPAVTIATLHAAKGLEWSSVVLAGMHDGGLPSAQADTPELVAEERRLCYVGVTRARDRLVLSWARARAAGGAPTRRPSRFLDGVLTDATAHRGSHDGRRRRARRPAGAGRGPVCVICGAALAPAEVSVRRCRACPSEVDPAVYERLRTWRSERAKADSVPAYVVFTDATLQGIATARPTTREQLGRIAGVGPVKLERYAADVLARCAGVDAGET